MKKRGLLQKNSHVRWDWTTFFEHPYLQPENLSQSTVALPQAPSQKEQGKQPTATPPAPTTPAKPIKALHYDPATPNNGWVQNIYVFFPHGQRVTIYLRPSNTVDFVKTTLAGMTHTLPSSQLLLDNSGNELSSNVLFSETDFWKHESPMYFIPKELLVCCFVVTFDFKY